MPIQPSYQTGTAEVTEGDKVVLGHGTAWSLNLVNGGTFILRGLSVPIASVESDTQLTLALKWPGPSVTDEYAVALGRADAASAIIANRKLSDMAQALSQALVSPGG